MDDSCLSGKEIEIVCEGFKNPLYPSLWENFYIKILDGEEKP